MQNFTCYTNKNPKQHSNISFWRMWLAESWMVFYLLKTLDLLGSSREKNVSFSCRDLGLEYMSHGQK